MRVTYADLAQQTGLTHVFLKEYVLQQKGAAGTVGCDISQELLEELLSLKEHLCDQCGQLDSSLVDLSVLNPSIDVRKVCIVCLADISIPVVTLLDGQGVPVVYTDGKAISLVKRDDTWRAVRLS